MRNYTAPRVDYSIEGDSIVTDGEWDTWKISGTYIGALLGLSPYMSPFTMSAKLLGLWDEDISDKPAVRTGKLLEERIIDYCAVKHADTGMFFKAEDLFAKREGNHENWKSDFEDEDFSGHVDGIISRDGEDYILEVKTVRDLSTWDGGIPPHYLWQVYLYNAFITKQDKAYFAIGIVTSDTYKDPYQWVPNKENCLLIEVPINQAMVSEKIEEIRAIRRKLCETRRTLPFDPTNPLDVELMTHLIDIHPDSRNLLELADEYEAVMRKLDSESLKVKDLQDRAELLKNRIKDVMLSHGVSKCGNLAISAMSRTTFNFDKAKEDGLDVTPYTKTTITYTLRRNKK